jgi:hypothetical protein
MKLSIGVILVGSLDWESRDYGPSFSRKLTLDDRDALNVVPNGEMTDY